MKIKLHFTAASILPLAAASGYSARGVLFRTRIGARMSEINRIDGATAAQSARSTSRVKQISSKSLLGINISVLLVSTFANHRKELRDKSVSENDAIFCIPTSISKKLGMQKMASFSLTPILRIELAPRRGERQHLQDFFENEVGAQFLPRGGALIQFEELRLR